jgi:precorrin-3B synthase
VSAPARRGVCPALSAPMPTGDGLLVRLSPASGTLSPLEFAGLCEGAIRCGNGILEVTARGSIQVRGLDPNSAARFADHVAALDIEPRTGLPVDVNPLAGLDPTMIADPRPLAEAIRSLHAGGTMQPLGPKVSVVVDGGGHFPLTALKADIRLRAEPHGGQVRWRLTVADDPPETGALLAAAEAAAMTIDLLSAIAKLGLDARARDLPGSLRPKPSSPTEQAPLTPTAPARAGDTMELSNRKTALVVALPFGTMEAAHLLRLLRHESSYRVSEIRPAPARRLLLICPSRAAAERLRAAVSQVGLVATGDDPRTKIAACTGAPACTSGRIATRTLAGAIAARLAPTAHLSLHISGCAKGCARQEAADLVIVGDENGAGLVVGGTASESAIAYVSRAVLESLPHRLAPLAEIADRSRRCAALRAVAVGLDERKQAGR